jgi:anti-sigma regulatory factor (Ser/Thr protein kinase)
MVLAIFDPAEDSLTVAAAGHPMPVLRGPVGVTPIDGLHAEGELGGPDAAPALGISYTEAQTTLTPSSSLICWTPRVAPEGPGWAASVPVALPVPAPGEDGAETDTAGTLAAQTAEALGSGSVLVVTRPAQATVGPVRVIELDLSEGEDPTRRARAFCYGVLSAWSLSPAVRDDIVLAVSELVANALLYGGAAEQLKLRRWPGRIVVEVFDREPAMPRPRIADADAESGRGLFLVRRVAQRWGARPVAGGKAVWCEFIVPPPEPEPEDDIAAPLHSVPIDGVPTPSHRRIHTALG